MNKVLELVISAIESLEQTNVLAISQTYHPKSNVPCFNSEKEQFQFIYDNCDRFHFNSIEEEKVGLLASMDHLQEDLSSEILFLNLTQITDDCNLSIKKIEGLYKLNLDSQLLQSDYNHEIEERKLWRQLEIERLIKIRVSAIVSNFNQHLSFLFTIKI